MRQLMWLLVIGLFGAAIQLLLTVKPPAQPTAVTAMPGTAMVEYRMGAIDPRFGLSEADILRLCAEAGRMWQLGLGKQVVHYNPNATLTVNLTYDARQQHSDYAQQQQANIQGQVVQADAQQRALADLQLQLHQKQQLLNNALAEHSQAVHSYNAKVDAINAADGAAEAVRDELQAEQQRHAASKAALDAQVDAYNQDIDALNGQLKHLAAQATHVNSMVNAFNAKHSGSYPFEKGHYKQSGQQHNITIYQFNNQVDLRIALAHEFGHALGLGHTGVPTAIMYPVLAAQNMAATEVTPADVNFYHASIGAQ